ncbi:MAG: hypothetical protein ACFFBS_00945 [Promethearchaeota archaeon]
MLPAAIKDPNEFIEISKRATECRVKRLKDTVKIKLRTKRMLYTLKTDPETADSVLDKIECAIVEV